MEPLNDENKSQVDEKNRNRNVFKIFENEQYHKL